jgi:hypothetical protein
MQTTRVARTALALALLACATPALADRGGSLYMPSDRTANNSFYLDGMGPGLLYSINYERIVEDDFGLRLGFSYIPLTGTASSGGSSASASVAFMNFPVTASYLGLRSGNHALEMGGGGVLVTATGSAQGSGMSVSGSGATILGTAFLGYRRQPPEGGFLFRIGVEALAGKGLALSSNTYDANKVGVIPWMYLSLGATL